MSFLNTFKMYNFKSKPTYKTNTYSKCRFNQQLTVIKTELFQQITLKMSFLKGFQAFKVMKKRLMH